MITISVQDTTMRFHTEAGLFSPGGLDAGTRAMLSHVSFSPEDKVLDLGCGYGVVGIYAALQIGDTHVTMLDNDRRAVHIARKNTELNGVPGVCVVQSDGFTDLADTGYTLILSNPPYHADFGVARRFIEKGFNRLLIGGKMVMVTKRKDWYKNKLIAIFGGVSIREIDGYFVFISEKRSDRYANANRKS